jgi:uncharacterized protein (TIGR03067 family)
MRCMMAMAVVTGLLLVGSSTGTAAGGKKGSIEGTWKAIKKAYGGKDEVVPDGKTITVTFAAGKMTVNDSGKIEEGTYKVDDSKKPRHVDLTMKKGEKTETMPGIYEVIDDTLKVCIFGGPKKTDDKLMRPMSFEAEGAMVLYLKRDSK